MNCENLFSSAGADRRLVTFFCLAKRKSPKKTRPRFADFPCVPQPNRALRNSRFALRQCSLHFPRFGFVTWRLTGGSKAQNYRKLFRLCSNSDLPTGIIFEAIKISLPAFSAPQKKCNPDLLAPGLFRIP